MTLPATPQHLPHTRDECALPSFDGWWERHRIGYNVVLAATFIALALRTWPRLRPELTTAAIPPLLFLAALANLLYCAAYAVDPMLRATRSPARRDRRRLVLWFCGTLFAMLLETYWFLDEILPPLLP